MEVVEAIEKRALTKKKDFETTSDYEARKADALSEKFLGDLSIESVFTFVVPVTKEDVYSAGLRYGYNADKGSVSVYVLPRSTMLNGIGGPSGEISYFKDITGLDVFDLKSKLVSNSSYQGSNAYGAVVTVRKSIMYQYGIAADRIPFLRFKRSYDYTSPSVASTFKLSPVQAAQELPKLKALLFLKLKTPYVDYNYDHYEPTINKAKDVSVASKYLTGDVLGIVFYSGLTGEIFTRVPAGFGRR